MMLTGCKVLQSTSHSVRKKKKKTKKKKKEKKKEKKRTAVSTTPPESTCQEIKQPKNSPVPKSSSSGAPVVSELSTQARESLRWEGALEDPQAEELRLEQYRTNRRQRYITHRDTVLRESQDAPRQAESHSE